MKKLIPALCMLLVAACLMGTSTYAWFAANEAVSATGMQVKAAADGGLAIASWKGTRGTAETSATAPTDPDYAATAEALWANIADDATIKPTSNNNGTWFTASATDASEHEGTNYKTVETTTTHYQKTKFRIKSLDQSASASYKLNVTGVTVSIKTSAADNHSLNDALRVAIVCDGTWYYFAPAYAADAELYYTEGLGTQQGAGTPEDPYYYPGVVAEYGETDKNTITCGASGFTTEIYDALTTAGIDIDVYVYYEGEDGNCTSNLAAKVDTLSVALDFSAVKN